MKRVILTLLFGVMAFAISSFARADLLSLLATPPNNVNDVLQDRSWGIGVVVKDDNVVYGLAAFDNIEVNGENINIGRSAWFVFAVKTQSDTKERTFNDPTGPQIITGYEHDPVTSGDYTLDNLIGVSGLAASNALLVLVDGIDYQNTTYLKYHLHDDQAANKALVDEAIKEIKSMGTPIVAFGLEDSQDFFFIESQGNPRKEFMGLSVVWTASGVDKNSFRPLFAESDQLVDLTQFEFSLRDFATVTIKKLNPEQDVFAWYTDRATALVNYVPEPGSVIGLLTLGFAAAGVRLARRRRK